MKKIKLNIIAALAKGAINVFRLEDKNYVMVLCHNKGTAIVPIVNKRAYVEAEEEETADIIEQIISETVKQKVFPELNEIKVMFRKAPEHATKVVSTLTTKGFVKYSGAEKILEEKGYSFEMKGKVIPIVEKDYSELLKDPFAKAIFDENHTELQKVGATFASLNTEVKMAYEGLAKGKYLGLIFAGPTGTGKSWAARIIADHMKAPYLTLQIDGGTSVDTLVGAFVPKAGEKVSTETANKIVEIIKDEKTSVSDALTEVQKLIKMNGEQSKWEFIPGPLLKAYKEGWPIVLEEVNFGAPSVLAKLNEFTDGTLRVMINGIAYKKHPNFFVIMTMNPGYAGTDPLNVALKGRFAKVNIPQLTKDQFCERMVGYSKGFGHALSTEFFARLYDFAGTIEALGNDTMYHEDVKFSVRNAQRLCDIILTKGRTLEEFSAAIAIQYINDLTMDNDNSEQVEKLKADATTVSQIASLYELYDFAEVATTEEIPALDSFFSIEEVGDESGDEILSDEDLDAMYSGM